MPQKKSKRPIVAPLRPKRRGEVDSRKPISTDLFTKEDVRKAVKLSDNILSNKELIFGAPETRSASPSQKWTVTVAEVKPAEPTPTPTYDKLEWGFLTNDNLKRAIAFVGWLAIGSMIVILSTVFARWLISLPGPNSQIVFTIFTHTILFSISYVTGRIARWLWYNIFKRFGWRVSLWWHSFKANRKHYEGKRK